MRALLALVLLLPLAWAPGGAAQGAQGGAAGEPLLSDAAGDVTFVSTTPFGAAPGVPSSHVESTRGCDLLALLVTEGDDALDLTVAVAAFSGDITGTALEAYLDWNGKDHRVLFSWFSGAVSTSDGGAFATLQVREGEDWSFVAQLDPPVVDVAAATISVHVPKVYILDAQQRMPGVGDVLVFERVVADATYSSFAVADLRVRDAMPDDDAAGGAPYTMQRGDFAVGSIALSSAQRVRVSNGGSTTFVFPATLRNPGEIEQEYALSIPDLMAEWNATLPGPVTVPPKGERTVSILVSVPFAHEHGGFSAFNLTVKGTRDPAIEARMRMGVLHTPIPQPAGHHSELYLHAESAYDGDLGAPFGTAFPYAWGWMNTVSDHANDAPYVTTGTGSSASSWFIPLNPRLMMGLDFDLERLGTLEGAISGGSGEAEVTAALYYWRDGSDDSMLLAEGSPVPITLDLQNEVLFSITLTPTLESDYVAYEPETYAYLVISFENGAPDLVNHPARPKLMTEAFKLTLPLNEYHDRLTGVAEAAETVDIVAQDVVEKAGLPGSVLTYPFTVRNNGPAQTFTIEVAGNAAYAARAVPRGDIMLATGETREILLAVEIPVRANDGQELEALLFVHARDDPTVMAIARTKTLVTTAPGEAAQDETAALLEAQARENQAPGVGGLVLVGAVALVAFALGRRR